MSLSVVFGSSGSGKSNYVYKKIINEAMANKRKNYICLVPEQYTMSTQKLLVEMHPAHCIMNIDVLSFDRLAYRIFDELSANTLDVLDDTGKSLVLRKLVEDHLEDLVALRKNMTKISYIAQVKSLISELTQYNNSPEKLKAMIDCDKMSKSFKLKGHDLLVLYEAFLDYTKDRYLTTESVLTRLNEILDDSEILAGSTIVLDGFTGFTPIQYDLVEHLLKVADEVIVTITGDKISDVFNHISKNYDEALLNKDYLFEMSSEFYGKLIEISKRAKVELNEPYFVDGKEGRFKENYSLAHLEKYLFRDKVCPFDNKESSEHIELLCLKNPRAELEKVAVEINKLIRKGMRFGDFAVVCPNLESYRYIADDIFNQYNIPYFLDAKTEILFHPFTEVIEATFEMFETDFSKDSVFRFLRSGMSDLELEEIDVLENYIISTGISGKKKYFHPFAIKSNSFYEEEQLIKLNEIREKFITPFLHLFEAVKSKDSDVNNISLALKVFFEELTCKEKIDVRKEIHENLGHGVKAKEYDQIYDVVIDLINKMQAILADEKMDMEEYSEIFKAGMAAETLGVIPPDTDRVIIGDIERTRINKVKVLFCVGASDDAIPKKVENGGILSQLEREQLLENGFTLAPTDRDKTFRQRFYLYLMLTKPSQKLIISSPRVGSDGKAVRISYLMDTISEMFPEVAIDIIEELDTDERIMTQTSAEEYLTELLQKSVRSEGKLSAKEQEDLIELLAWAKTSEKIDLKSIIDTVFYVHENEKVSADIMLAVNEAFNEDETVSGSISKFEQYASCAYRYFLTYVLKLQEREEFELSSIDMGNLYHDSLDNYGRLLLENEIKWHDITDEEKDFYIKKAIERSFSNMPKVTTLEDATLRYIVDSMKTTLKFTVDILTEQIKRGTFEPEAFEETFKCLLRDYESGEPVAKLTGKVDRIDVTDERPNENGKLERGVRIIDYKLSDHRLKTDSCYYGLSLQLPIYMGVVLENLKKKYKGLNLVPSALLYYTTDNPFIGRTKELSEQFESRMKASRLEGMLSNELTDLLDNDSTVNEENSDSAVVPFSMTKSGAPGKKETNISREEMDTLIKFASYKASEISKDILSGKFEPNPAEQGSYFACTYCSFKGICHFNENDEGFEKRELKNMKPDEALPLMAQALLETGIRKENVENGAD